MFVDACFVLCVCIDILGKILLERRSLKCAFAC